MKSHSSGSGSRIEDSLYTVGSAHYDEDSSVYKKDKNDEKILIPILDNWHIIPLPYPYS